MLGNLIFEEIHVLGNIIIQEIHMLGNIFLGDTCAGIIRILEILVICNIIIQEIQVFRNIIIKAIQCTWSYYYLGDTCAWK